MVQEPYFHFFRNYDAIIHIHHIGQKINQELKSLSLSYTFTMNFDNKRYTFIGYSDQTDQLPFNQINNIQQLLLLKERPVTLLGINNNIINIDFKFTREELDFLSHV